MKVLVSAYACDPSRGGEFTNGWNYAYNAIHGISVWCITTTEGKDAINRRLALEPVPGLHIVYVDIPDWIQKIKERVSNYGVYFHYWYFQRQAGKIAKELNRDIQFDVVHHATYGSLQLGTFLWRLNKPMLFGPLGGGQKAPRDFKKYFARGWTLEILRGMVSHLLLDVIGSPVRALKKSGITLVVNQETYELAKRYGAKNVVYAPCTLLPDTFAPAVIPERNEQPSLRLLWVGRLLARKGLRLVLEALSGLDRKMPVTLTIIGDGAQETELPRWLAELNLQDRVTWKRRQPLSYVQEAYARHDVFVYCSLRESLGSQIFESMSYGLPLIILNQHGVKTFVPDDAAWKIEVAAPQQTKRAISDAIAYLYYHPEKRKALGEQAFKVAREFTWSNRIHQISEFYRQLADVNNVSVTCNNK